MSLFLVSRDSVQHTRSKAFRIKENHTPGCTIWRSLAVMVDAARQLKLLGENAVDRR